MSKKWAKEKNVWKPCQHFTIYKILFNCRLSWPIQNWHEWIMPILCSVCLEWLSFLLCKHFCIDCIETVMSSLIFLIFCFNRKVEQKNYIHLSFHHKSNITFILVIWFIYLVYFYITTVTMKLSQAAKAMSNTEQPSVVTARYTLLFPSWSGIASCSSSSSSPTLFGPVYHVLKGYSIYN